MFWWWCYVDTQYFQLLSTLSWIFGIYIFLYLSYTNCPGTKYYIENDFYLQHSRRTTEKKKNSISASYSIIWKFMRFFCWLFLIFSIAYSTSVMFQSINHQIYCLMWNMRKAICWVLVNWKFKRILLHSKISIISTLNSELLCVEFFLVSLQSEDYEGR